MHRASAAPKLTAFAVPVLLLVFACLACPQAALAANVSGDGWEFNSQTGALSITSNSGTTAWRDGVSDKKAVKSVIISDDVSSIGPDAFKGCKSLKSVDLSYSVSSLGDRAFQECKSLASIRIPSNVTSMGDAVFSWCTALESIDLPMDVTSIGDFAFCGCTSLETIDLPMDVTSVGESAFQSCISLKSVDIPYSVTSLGDAAFRDCAHLETVQLPSVTSIGSETFFGCTSLANIDLPAEVTSIGSEAFYGCTSLAYIDLLPTKVTSIGDRAFSRCTSLACISIPRQVATIGSYAFSGCSSLAFVDLHPYELSVGNYAFSDCASLNKVYCTSSESTRERIVIDWGSNSAFRDATWVFDHIHQTSIRVIAPTCTERGYREEVCDCGAVLLISEYKNALGHNWSEWSESTATCTEAGEETRKCTRCDATETRKVAAKGHEWANWTESKAPTCTEAGEETCTCTRCDATETRAVAATGHTPEVVEGKAATCTEAGLTEGSRCSVCGEVITAQEEIPALGHEWSEWAESKAATCTEDGEETRTCTRCGATETRVVAAKGHTPEAVEGKAATCTETGLTEGSRCSVCGEVLTAQEEIPALGHDWPAWLEPEGHVCSMTGKETITCTRCGQAETREHKRIAVKGYTAEIGIPGKTDGAKCACGAWKAEQSVIPAKNPSSVKLSKLVKGKKSLTAKWAKSTSENATGYQVRYSLKKSMKSSKAVTVKGYKTASKKIGKLKAGKKYYVQVRVYKVVNGKKWYSSWSAKKSVKVA